MKVLKSLPISGEGWAFTTLLLPANIPHGKWVKVVSDGIEYETIWMSGGRLDAVSIKGAHDLTGMEIEFV